jgi:cholesterol 24(S)-hydroxylase
METMVDDFMTFFLAGQETTANSLSFAFLEVCKNPEIVEKAREEIDRVLGERTEVTYQDVNDLKYCSAIFKEALRLYPPVTNVARKLTEDMTVDGIDLPKKTYIWVHTKL